MSFPDTAKETIATVMREVGIANLSIKVLRQRLETKYGQDFTQHKEAIQEAVDSLMATKEFQKELTKVKKQKEKIVGGTKKKEGSSRAPKGEKGAKKEKSAKVAKESKPDDYPKAALTAYFLFANDRRAELKVSEPTLKVTEIGKRIGEMWKEQSEDAKKSYADKAVQDKIRFEQEMQAYLAKGGEKIKRGRSEKADKKGKKKARKEKDPNAPKRPMSAYFLFMNAKRDEVKALHPELKMVDLTRKLVELYKNADEATKAKYEDLATKAKEKYTQECAARGIAPKASKPSKGPRAKKDAASSSSDDSSDSSSDSDSDSSSSSSSSSDSD